MASRLWRWALEAGAFLAVLWALFCLVTTVFTLPVLLWVPGLLFSWLLVTAASLLFGVAGLLYLLRAWKFWPTRAPLGTSVRGSFCCVEVLHEEDYDD